jgi:hypothetical protein
MRAKEHLAKPVRHAKERHLARPVRHAKERRLVRPVRYAKERLTRAVLRGKKRRAAKEPAEAVQAVEAPLPGTRPPEKKPAGERRPRRERQKEDVAVVGLGEHVPAFLMTPIKRAKPTA